MTTQCVVRAARMGFPKMNKVSFRGSHYTEERSKTEIKTRFCVVSTRPSPVSRTSRQCRQPNVAVCAVEFLYFAPDGIVSL